jgi:hypothetical protein
MSTLHIEAPAPKTRKYKQKNTEKFQAQKHAIVAAVPHTGWQLVLSDIVKELTAIFGTDVYEFSEYRKWREHGGILTMCLSDVNINNNKQVCELFSIADHRVYIHEAYQRRWREVCVLEFASEKNISQLMVHDKIQMDTNSYFNEAGTFTACWQQVFNIWHKLFPGHYDCVSERWKDTDYPWPMDVAIKHRDGGIEGRGRNGWRDAVQGDNRSIYQIDPEYIAQFVHRVPLYAK